MHNGDTLDKLDMPDLALGMDNHTNIHSHNQLMNTNNINF